MNKSFVLPFISLFCFFSLVPAARNKSYPSRWRTTRHRRRSSPSRVVGNSRVGLMMVGGGPGSKHLVTACCKRWVFAKRISKQFISKALVKKHNTMHTDRRASQLISSLFGPHTPPIIGIHWANIRNPATSEVNLTISPRSTNIICCKLSNVFVLDSYPRCG